MKNNSKSKNQQKNIDGIVKPEEIMGTKEESVENANLAVSDTNDLETQSPKEVSKEKTAKVKTSKSKPKKTRKGFLGKTIEELKLVEWPSFKYVVGWSLTIILFTAMIGSLMGFTDYYFESGLKFIDCTSPNGSKNRTVDECLKDLTTNLTFQNYFNRDNTAAPTTTPSTETTPTDTPTETGTSAETPVSEPTITTTEDIQTAPAPTTEAE